MAMQRPRLAFLVSSALCFFSPLVALPPGDAASLGFDAERLARIDTLVKESLSKEEIVGALAYVARDGKVVKFDAYGLMDRERSRPMKEDTLFRIASMSKAVTTVAVMMLYEEGRFLLNDPVSKYIPSFSQPTVAVAPPAGSPEGVKYVLMKAKREITIRDLLTHTAGLTYGDGPANELYQKAGLVGWYLANKDETIAAVVDRLASLPLHGQPGEAFQYGYSTDVLGRLVEVVSGQPLDVFFRERIFKPLKMDDTAFFIDPSKANRLMPVYGIENGKLVLKETSEKSDYVNGPRKCFSGGAGLVSSAPDYGRFLQMLLNEGELEGARLLSPATVRFMSVNHTGTLFNWDTRRFGLGFWVNPDLGAGGEMLPEGSYGWGSAYYPQYMVDPEHKLVAMFFTQLTPAANVTLNQRFKVVVTQAIVK